MTSILDEVIDLIRHSNGKADSKKNLIEKFAFTEEQAEAIVTLQLYRLTNTDVVELEEELANLQKLIEGLKAIISDEEALKYVMKKELKMVRKEYAVTRKTEIVDEMAEIKLDITQMIPKESTLLVITNEGYVKRVSTKSFKSSDGETMLKPGDYVKNLFETNTLQNVVMFTNLGNYLFVPIHKIFEAKWKDLGKHISNLVPLQEGERIINSFIQDNNKTLSLFTKDGMVKNILMKDLVVSRFNKTMTSIKLKDNDELISVRESLEDVLIVTKNGNYLRYKTNEIPVVGPKAAGVKGIKLTEDEVVSGMTLNNSSEYLNVFTNNNTAKRVKIDELKYLTRAKKGTSLIKKNKTVTYLIESAYITSSRDTILVKMDNEIKEIKNSEIPIMDLSSNGGSLIKGHIDKYDIKCELEEVKIEEIKEEDKEKEEPKEKQISFAEFTEGFKI
jgi:topoisomerase-4 subunit A